MKILYIVPYVPNRIRVRPYQLLQTLVQQGHAITLATLWNTPQEQADLQQLAQLGINLVAQPLSTARSLWNCLGVLPSRTPLQAVYCWQPALIKQIQQLLQRTIFDLVHVEHLRGAPYGLALQRLRQGAERPTPVVWDSVDCISHLFAQAAQQSSRLSSRLLTRLELPRTQRYEGWLVQQFARVLVTSQGDRQALYDLGRRTCGGCTPGEATPQQDTLAERLIVLPNGVDLTYFSPSANDAPAIPLAGQPPTIVFSGKMSYHANVTAACYLVQEIMPLVWRRHPEVVVQIVGKDPPPMIRALATRCGPQAGGQADQVGIVEVTGTVPEVPPYLRQATIAVAPVLYSAGIQNKVLEAMACGAPVVASVQAAAGIAAQPDREICVAASAQAFADQIQRLLQDQAARRQLGQAGRRYVERRHAWSAIGTQLEEIYQTTIECALSRSA